jgi:3-hydroxyisobutyrate dehydrogenase
MNVPLIAFFGLGAIGWPIAQRLKNKGYKVMGFDVNPSTVQRWRRSQESGDRDLNAHDHRQQTLQQAAIVFVCVSDETASRMVFSTVLPLCQPGTLVIEIGSVSVTWALDCEQSCAKAGLRYVDAPLSGGVAAAESGTLVAMLGAKDHDVDEATLFLSSFSKSIIHVGLPGSGQLCKMANQLAIAGIAAGLVQAQMFSRHAGLNLAKVFSVLQAGSAASVQLERLSTTLAAPDNHAADTFAWLEKDLQFCQQASSAPLPINTLWHALWQEHPS